MIEEESAFVPPVVREHHSCRRSRSRVVCVARSATVPAAWSQWDICDDDGDGYWAGITHCPLCGEALPE